jgi:hypothetical protein
LQFKQKKKGSKTVFQKDTVLCDIFKMKMQISTPYAPDAKRKKILDAAGAEVHKYLLDQYVNGINSPFYGKQ